MKYWKKNLWSVDNEMAKVEEEKARIKRKKGKRGWRMKNVVKRKRIGDGFVVSGAMLMEVETVLQTQDGSYSRGPVDIPIGEHDESNYFIYPTYKFEQVCS